jgi:LysR family hydrogen peroxide-inducible transcriptional activator
LIVHAYEFMNLRDLAYLVALADHRHFGRAADASNVSQPTLSGQIRKLEEELGIALFERDSRNVVPTAAGEAIAAEARAALTHADAIRDLARAHRDPLSGRFRLGVIATLGPFLVPDLLAGLGVDAPRMEVFCVEDLTGPLLARLRARELDAVLLATGPDGDDLTERVLFDEPFLIAHAPEHPLAARAAVGLEDIEDGTLLLLSEGHCLRDQALSVCGTAAVDMRLQAASLMTLLQLVGQGNGTTLVPALAARWTGQLVLRVPAGEAPTRRVRLVARRNTTRAGALDLVAETVCAIARAGGLEAGEARPGAPAAGAGENDAAHQAVATLTP